MLSCNIGNYLIKRQNERCIITGIKKLFSSEKKVEIINRKLSKFLILDVPCLELVLKYVQETKVA